MTINKIILKNILTLFAFIAVVTITSCKKDNEALKPQFADIEFSIYDLRPPGDTTATEIIYPNTIILKGDYTWTIDLGGAKSNGTYSWKPTSSQQGDIKFTITNWTTFATNPVLSTKLMSAIVAVKRYGFSLQTPSFNNFLVEDCQCDKFPFIRTNKK
jgi:hypothetical protein